MSIETIGGIKDILSSYNSKDWSKTASVDEFSSVKFDSLSLDELNESKKTHSFGEVLANSIGEVNNLQKEANTAIQKLVTGESKNIHETMLTVEKAEIAFKTMNQVRQKVIDAYREIMRMQM